MKVLYIIDTLYGSGAEISLVEIALNFKNTTPIFVHLYPGNQLKAGLEEKGIKVYSLDIKKKYGLSEAQQLLKEIYIRENPDIIHSTLYRADLVARLMKGKFPEIPLVGSFVSNSYNSLRYKDKNFFLKVKLYLTYWQDRISSKKVDFYISNSNAIKTAEGGMLRIPESKIKVIFRGRESAKFEDIDDGSIQKLRDDYNLGNRKVLLNVSRLIKSKGQDELIKCMPAILKKHPNTVLIIAGEGNFRTELERLIHELDIAQNVKLIGRSDDIPQLLCLADLFLYPSHLEGLPGALIEAMMASKVIISSDLEENLECVNESCAVIYPLGDLESIKNNIIDVLETPLDYKHLAINAKKIALKKFEIAQVAMEYEQVYKDLVK